MINCVTTLSKRLWNHEPQASHSAVNFDNFITQFSSRLQTHKKTDVNLLLQKQDPKNGQMPGGNEGKDTVNFS